MPDTQSLYDTFLSHSHKDAAIVAKIASRLEDDYLGESTRFKVWLDKWVLIPGNQSFVQDMAKGLSEAKTCVVFIGSTTPKGWFQQEIDRALNRQASDPTFRVIPVILPESQVKVDDFLALKTWVKFETSIDEKRPFWELICAIQGNPPGRKYTQQPIQAALGSDLALVNCNRKKILYEFLEAFENKQEEGKPGHLYLLHDQRYGQSESLVRRLVTYLYQQYSGVWYPGFHQLQVRDIDFHTDVEVDDARFILRKGFNRSLKPEVRSLEQLLSQAANYHPQWERSNYLPLVLRIKIPQVCWEQAGRPGLEWFLQDFLQLSKSYPQIPVIFILLKIEAAQSAKTKTRFSFLNRKKPQLAELNMQDLLEALALKASLPCTVLPPLMRVRIEDLHDWYRAFEKNESIRDRKVQDLEQALGKSSEGWHMADVERELQKVIEVQQNAAYNL